MLQEPVEERRVEEGVNGEPVPQALECRLEVRTDSLLRDVQPPGGLRLVRRLGKRDQHLHPKAVLREEFGQVLPQLVGVDVGLIQEERQPMVRHMQPMRDRLLGDPHDPGNRLLPLPLVEVQVDHVPFHRGQPVDEHHHPVKEPRFPPPVLLPVEVRQLPHVCPVEVQVGEGYEKARTLSHSDRLLPQESPVPLRDTLVDTLPEVPLQPFKRMVLRRARRRPRPGDHQWFRPLGVYKHVPIVPYWAIHHRTPP